MALLPSEILVPFAFVLGLILGSFGTVVAYRTPRWESLTGRSACPNCGHTITAAENIPLISFLIQRGRCRNCGTRISPRYPAIELATASLFALFVARFGWSFESIMFMAFAWVLVVLTVIDFELHRLPDVIVLPALLVFLVGVAVACALDGRWGERTGPATAGAVLTALSIALVLPGANLRPSADQGDGPVAGEGDAASDDPVVAAASAEDDPPASKAELVLGLVYLIVWFGIVISSLLDGPVSRLWGALLGAAIFSGLFFALSLMLPRGMGLGDAKLALLLGAAAGYVEAPGRVLASMFLAFLIGSIGGIAAMLIGGGSRKTRVPFGPALAAGTVVALLWGRGLIDWYVNLLG